MSFAAASPPALTPPRRRHESAKMDSAFHEPVRVEDLKVLGDVGLPESATRDQWNDTRCQRESTHLDLSWSDHFPVKSTKGAARQARPPNLMRAIV